MAKMCMTENLNVKKYLFVNLASYIYSLPSDNIFMTRYKYPEERAFIYHKQQHKFKSPLPSLYREKRMLCVLITNSMFLGSGPSTA